MSEPKRYAIRGFSAALVEEDNGVFIRYEDYARLKAEIERLTAFTTRTIIPNEELQAENARLKAEVDSLAMSEGYHYTAIAVSMLKEQLHQKHIDYVEARKANEAKVEMITSLKAEVERLTKAGDAMADSINGDYNYSLPCIEAWNAAKEGKQ